MLTYTLEEIIKQSIKELANKKINDRVESFVDYKSQYTVLKPSVKVEISLSDGIVAKLNVTDLFEKELADGKK